MSEELDPNKIAAEFVTQNIESLYSTGKDLFKGAADKARLRLGSSYKDYLACVSERYSKAKSFFIRTEPSGLYDFYVPIGITSGNKSIRDASIRTISSVNRFAVITGGGGSGKSMLMRHLLLDAVIQKEKTPIFLELRELNQTGQSLLAFIKDTLHSNRFTLDDEYIEKALKAGHFALLFDGFDELTDALRSDVRKQIFQLTKSYDRNVILVSSRPDNEFSGWAAFNVFSMNSLTLGQASALIEKLPFEDELKIKFIKDLGSGLFRRHKSFLSNPLLLSIMLLTYGQSANIPDKLSIFYGQAYEALFQRHDALKAGFQRERLTGLNVQDFAKAFSLFSLLTYDKRIFQMSKTEALELIEKSKRLSSLDFDSEDFLKDAERAVCLLIEEGMQVVFAHRSFQEYFTAKYILSAKPEAQEKLLAKYSSNLRRDGVMGLLYEMNSELVERLFIIPGILKLERSLGIKKRVGVTHFLRYFKKLVSEVEVDADGDVMLMAKDDISLFDFVHFVRQQCGHLVGDKNLPQPRPNRALWKKLFKELPVQVIPSTLTTRSELIPHLGKISSNISIDALNSVVRIKDVLLKKHANLDKSLDEIILS